MAKKTRSPAKIEFPRWLKETMPIWRWNWRHQRYLYERLHRVTTGKTYDLNTAASAAWLIKAARVSMTVEVDPPGSGIVTSQVFDNCRAMARIYAAKRRMSVSLR